MKLKHILAGALCLVGMMASACYFDPSPSLHRIDMGFYSIRYQVPIQPTDNALLMDLGEIRLPFTMYSALSANNYASEGFGTINRICLEYKVMGTTNWIRVKDYTTDQYIANTTGATKVNWAMNFDDVVSLFGKEVITDASLKGKNIVIRLYVASDLIETGDLDTDINLVKRFDYWWTPGEGYRDVDGDVVALSGGWKPGYVFTARVSDKAGIKR